jgi:hypothetical protein
MFAAWGYEIARERQQGLLASAERYRLGRVARDRPTQQTRRPRSLGRLLARLTASGSGLKHRVLAFRG